MRICEEDIKAILWKHRANERFRTAHCPTWEEDYFPAERIVHARVSCNPGGFTCPDCKTYIKEILLHQREEAKKANLIILALAEIYT